MTEINQKKLRISSILLIAISLLELIYGFLVDHIITDVTLFLLAVSFYLAYRVNGNTLTLVEKWQKKYGLELKEKDLLVEKRLNQSLKSVRFIIMRRAQNIKIMIIQIIKSNQI